MEEVNDTLTLTLDGEVSLEDFSAAMVRLQDLVAALTDELAATSELRWVIDHLHAGSATATARGVVELEEARPGLAAVTQVFLDVGRALERRLPEPYSPRVEREARLIAGMLTRVQAIRFETAEDEAVLSEELGDGLGQIALLSRSPAARYRALGAVRGRIQTLSSRGGLRFTLFDALNNRASRAISTRASMSSCGTRGTRPPPSRASSRATEWSASERAPRQRGEGAHRGCARRLPPCEGSVEAGHRHPTSRGGYPTPT